MEISERYKEREPRKDLLFFCFRLASRKIISFIAILI